MDRKTVYKALNEQEGLNSLNAHLRNKAKVHRRVFIALSFICLSSLMPYIFIELYLIKEASMEPINQWVQRAGGLMLLFGLVAEFIGIDAKDVAGLGGQSSHPTYVAKLIHFEARRPVMVITVGASVQIALGTILSTYGDLIFNKWWPFIFSTPIIFALLTLLAAGVAIHANRPVSFND